MAEFTAEDMEKLLAPYGGMANALTMLATRPQKSLVRTNSVSTSTPYALENMIANRDRIGQASARLSDTLRAQENPWFSTIKALGQVQGSTEPGGWLESGLKGFSTGATMLADIKAANDALRLENTMKDLETILKYDKEMGSTQTQNQHQTIGYENLPWGGVGNKGKTQQGVGPKDVVNTENAATTLGDLYKTIDANPQAFSAIGGIKQDAISTGLKSGVDVMGVDTMGKREFSYLQSIMPQGFATTINSAKEQEIMRPYTTKFHNGRGSEKKATIKGMLGSIYDAYAADAAAQGFQMPITKEQYIQSRIDGGREINAEWFSKPDVPMYKVSPAVQERQQQQEQTKKNYMQFLEGAS